MYRVQEKPPNWNEYILDGFLPCLFGDKIVPQKLNND